MATRSQIAISRPDGKFASIYCHNDGAPHWNGRVLVSHYHSPGRAASIIAQGNLSELGPEIGVKHDPEWRMKDYTDEKVKALHPEITELGAIWRKSDELVQADPRYAYCKVHSRDYPQRSDWRNKAETRAVIHDDERAMIDYFEESDREYLYLWRGETWWLHLYDGGDQPWQPLVDAVNEDETFQRLVREGHRSRLIAGPKPFIRSRCVPGGQPVAAPAYVPSPVRSGRRAIVI